MPSHPLDYLARSLRRDLLTLLYQSGGGHLGGSFSSLDLLIAIYFSNVFNFKSDKFILSAGHLAPALYVVLAEASYFPKDLLPSYGQFGSILQGHVSAQVPGINYSSGSLGQGLSFAAGQALGLGSRHSVICLTSDGEHQEGQIWEAVMFANKYHLGNLINIVDCNGYQIDGPIEKIMPLDSLAAKYLRFGWTVITVNGHDFKSLIKAFARAKTSTVPSCIIAKTILGHGLSFAKNNYHFHDVKNLPEKLYRLGLKELHD